MIEARLLFRRRSFLSHHRHSGYHLDRPDILSKPRLRICYFQPDMECLFLPISEDAAANHQILCRLAVEVFSETRSLVIVSTYIVRASPLPAGI